MKMPAAWGNTSTFTQLKVLAMSDAIRSFVVVATVSSVGLSRPDRQDVAQFFFGIQSFRRPTQGLRWTMHAPVPSCIIEDHPLAPFTATTSFTDDHPVRLRLQLAATDPVEDCCYPRPP